MGIEELLADHRTHQVVRTMFEDLKRTGALLKPSDSAGKLVALLRRRNFKSGDHVDYYDEKVEAAVQLQLLLLLQAQLLCPLLLSDHPDHDQGQSLCDQRSKTSSVRRFSLVLPYS